MKTFQLLGITVKIHNKREAKLVRIIEGKIEYAIKHYKENEFGLVSRYMDEINEDFGVLYYMDCISKPIYFFITDILEIKEVDYEYNA